MAHLKFGTPTHGFYELVRSKTGAVLPLELVASVRNEPVQGGLLDLNRYYYLAR